LDSLKKQSKSDVSAHETYRTATGISKNVKNGRNGVEMVGICLCNTIDEAAKKHKKSRV
jgi:hypothetical protein